MNQLARSGVMLAVLGIALAVDTAEAQAPAERPRPTAAARKTLAKGKAPMVSPDDIAKLASPDVEVAVRAVETLGRNAAPEAHDALLDALAMGLPPVVAIAALAAVGSRPAQGDLPSLRRYASHHEPTVRSAALAAIGSYRELDAQAIIVAAFGDPVATVRDAAAGVAGRTKLRTAAQPMLTLLARGEESSARGLAAMADPELARVIAEQLGKVPDDTLVVALGGVLVRPDFGPDPARVELVRAIAKIQGTAAQAALAAYLAAAPKAPPRKSREEAQMVLSARTGGS